MNKKIQKAYKQIFNERKSTSDPIDPDYIGPAPLRSEYEDMFGEIIAAINKQKGQDVGQRVFKEIKDELETLPVDAYDVNDLARYSYFYGARPFLEKDELVDVIELAQKKAKELGVDLSSIKSDVNKLKAMSEDDYEQIDPLGMRDEWFDEYMDMKDDSYWEDDEDDD